MQNYTLDKLKQKHGWKIRTDGVVETYSINGNTYFWTEAGDGTYRLFATAPKIEENNA